MREIKFRGMDIKGNWYHGNLSILKQNVDHVKAGSYISNKVGLPFAYQVRPETVEQFTGLFDKNGNEIYEGDIWQLKETGYIGVVVWRWSRWDFEKAKSSKVYQYPEFNNYANKGEIIGNIHEKSEVKP